MEEVSAKEIKTTTGSMASGVVTQVQVGGKEDNKEGFSVQGGQISKKTMGENAKRTCDADCKINTLTGIGIRPEIAESLVINCKAMAENPVNCIRIGAFIVKNESGGGYRCKDSNKFNCFGLSIKENYKSYDDGTLHWVGKYNKYWYNQRNPDTFYPNVPGEETPTGYCKSERQSDGTTLNYCPNGYRNAWIIYNKLKEW